MPYYDDPDYYDPGYYDDHYPPPDDEERWSEPEPDEMPPELDKADTADPQPDEADPQPDEAPPSDPSLAELVNGETEASEPDCNCIECLQARGEEITPEMIEKSRFGSGLELDRGHAVLAGFKEDGTESEQIDDLCACWYPKLVGCLTDPVKMEIHQRVSTMVPVQGQEIPEDEREDFAPEQLMSDMDAILGKFRKKP
jgi:hypothetical protein